MQRVWNSGTHLLYKQLPDVCFRFLSVKRLPHAKLFSSFFACLTKKPGGSKSCFVGLLVVLPTTNNLVHNTIYNTIY